MRRCLCKYTKLLLLYSFLILGISLSSETSDIVLVLDTSRSLLGYYDEISGRVLKEVCENYTKKNDEFHLISFSTYPRLEISRTIDSETDFSFIVSNFLLNYPLTKDSNLILALDFIKEYLSSLPISQGKKLIFISDGFFTSPEDSNYAKEDFEKKLHSFSTYLGNLKNIKTYYIKLPISSNQVVLDLQNDLSYFAKNNYGTIEAYPLVYNLPSSLKEYLYFDKSEKTVSIKKKQSLQTSNISFTNTLDDKHAKTQTTIENKEAENLVLETNGQARFDSITKHESNNEQIEEASRIELSEKITKQKTINDENIVGEDYKEESVESKTFIDDHKTSFEKYERKSELLKSTMEESNSYITDSKGADENNFQSLSTYKMHSIEKKKGSDLAFHKTYIFLFVGFLLSLIIFFITKKYSSKQKKSSDIELPTVEEIEVAIRENDEFFTKLENQYKELETKYNEKEVLDSDHNPSTEDRLHISNSPDVTTISEDKKANVLVKASNILPENTENLTKPTKILTEDSSVLKSIPKDEKILLNIKTIENKLTTKYAPTFFTLSPDTKKAFFKGNAIENMVSILNTTYGDSGDIFYRFKHSLYTKKYVKNIDATKKNYIEMFVANQRRSIGMRNTHPLTLNKTFHLGGRHDDFLIFLVSLPSKLASIHYDEKEIILKILKPEYFPYETELEIRNPIDRFFVINSEKNYSIHFMFRIYEKEILPSSKTIHN